MITKLKKANGVFIFGAGIIVVCLLFFVWLVSYFTTHQDSSRAQLAADAFANAIAVQMSIDEPSYDAAVETGYEMMSLINDEMRVNITGFIIDREQIENEEDPVLAVEVNVEFQNHFKEGGLQIKKTTSVRILDGSSIPADSYNGVPYYCQGDYPHIQYGPNAEDNVANCGCALCCFCMVASKILHQAITPEDAAPVANRLGAWAWVSGRHVMMQRLCNYYGIEEYMVYNGGALSALEVANYLRDGYLVVQSTHRNPVLNGPNSAGHLVLLTGITSDNKVLINDPQSREMTIQFNTTGLDLSTALADAQGHIVFRVPANRGRDRNRQRQDDEEESRRENSGDSNGENGTGGSDTGGGNSGGNSSHS